MTALPLSFAFHRYPPLSNGHLTLRLLRGLQGVDAMDAVPAYLFNICHPHGQVIGQIDIRISLTPYLLYLGGQIGYGIDPAYRGRGYAAQACELIKPVAWDHGLQHLWITCNPDNLASRKTCEHIGAEYINTLPVPPTTELFRRGDRAKCRYYWSL